MRNFDTSGSQKESFLTDETNIYVCEVGLVTKSAFLLFLHKPFFFFFSKSSPSAEYQLATSSSLEFREVALCQAIGMQALLM